jgi:hypothetical protein
LYISNATFRVALAFFSLSQGIEMAHASFLAIFALNSNQIARLRIGSFTTMREIWPLSIALSAIPTTFGPGVPKRANLSHMCCLPSPIILLTQMQFLDQLP